MKKHIPSALAHTTTFSIAFHGIFTALMLILGFIESQFILVPGIPGIKLGLSNIVLVFSLCLISASSTWLLMILKVVLSALLFSGITGLSYAFCGGFFSILVMWLLLRCRVFGMIAISICGAAAHILGQVLCSRLLLGTWAAAVQLPYLLLFSAATGLFTGMTAGKLCHAFMGLFPHGKTRLLQFNLTN